jgi:hypothetical protein
LRIRIDASEAWRKFWSDERRCQNLGNDLKMKINVCGTWEKILK